MYICEKGMWCEVKESRMSRNNLQEGSMQGRKIASLQTKDKLM